METTGSGNRAQEFAWSALSNGTARKLREAAGYSLVKAAGIAGVSKDGLWKWEMGLVRPTKVSATAYGCFLINLARFYPQVVDHE